MGDESVRWTIVVDKATDFELRTYLAQKGMKKGGLSRFVEDTVKRELMREALQEMRAGFADLSPEEAQAMADEAVAEARKLRAK